MQTGLVDNHLQVVGTDGASPPTRNMKAEEAAANSYKQARKERNAWETRCQSVEAALEDTKRELAQTQLAIQEHRGTPVKRLQGVRDEKQMWQLVEAYKEIELLKEDVVKLKAMNDVSSAKGSNEDALSSENHRLREALRQAKKERIETSKSHEEICSDMRAKIELANNLAAEARERELEAIAQQMKLHESLESMERRVDLVQQDQRKHLVQITEGWKNTQHKEVGDAHLAVITADKAAMLAKQEASRLRTIQAEQSRYIQMLQGEIDQMRSSMR